MSSNRTIVDRLLSGDEYDLTKIDDEIEAWHEADTSLDLHEWLGFTQEEYALFVEKPQHVRLILSLRSSGVPLTKVSNTNDQVALAARGANPQEVEELRKWLSKTGRI